MCHLIIKKKGKLKERKLYAKIKKERKEEEKKKGKKEPVHYTSSMYLQN